VINITLFPFCDNMFGKTIFVVAAIAASLGLIVGMATVPYSQTAAADKDCSVGRILKESKPDNWGQLLSEEARTTNGVGDAFSGANAICHAD
jgi:hypothetical protein